MSIHPVFRATHRVSWLVGAMALLAVSAVTAQAQTPERLPALFSVTGVEADDVLNIREEPQASAGLIGSLEPDAEGVEVIRRDESGRWGLVNSRERAGWVAMRYLAAEPNEDERALPEELSCYGTEPFWGLRRAGDLLEFSTPEEDGIAFTAGTVLTSVNRLPPHWAVLAHEATGGSADEGGRLTAIIEPTMCSDGMSERQFGLSITLIDERPPSPRALSGCCSLRPPA